ncbi:MAG: hypothetical protein J0L97_04045 [Alphaproteobacteria bacterium]|nr:hypothetical protein [Alphaproteobacteria bacterium]
MEPLNPDYAQRITDIAQNHGLKLTQTPPEQDRQMVPDQVYRSADGVAIRISGVGKKVEAAMNEVAGLLGKEDRDAMRGLVKDLFQDDIMQARRREAAAAERFSVGKAFSSMVGVLTSLHQIGQEGSAADSFVRRITNDRFVGIRAGRTE